MLPQPPDWVKQTLHSGIVIPAHPLALNDDGSFNETAQRNLTRYYHASGAGGVAVGVHTTQFEIREHGLLAPVLQCAAETIHEADAATNRKSVLIAGVVGKTPQAIREAQLAKDLGYHAVLLSLSAFQEADVAEMLAHCTEVANVMPLIGFYLQPSVGGRLLPRDFWREFAEIPNVIAIKIAPFNRYQTLDVVRGVAESSRWNEIALYTGNDDNILYDLTTTFRISTAEGIREMRFAGGLLGHWACWTKRATEHLAFAKEVQRQRIMPTELHVLANQITEANAALFDVDHAFKGCIAGIHYVLHRQGLLPSLRCLNPHETLSDGQAEAIERIMTAYPHLSEPIAQV